MLSQIFSDESLASEFSGKGEPAGVSVNFDEGLTARAERVKRSLRSAIRKLESITVRLELIPEDLQKSEPLENRRFDASRVFIVHGRDEGALQSVARFVEQLGLQATVLGEQPNAGRTIIEKFESHSDAGFAIILLTPDDVGALKGKTAASRARQNVIFEYGFFIGKLGRSRVCALYDPDVELPSDVHGLLYISLDPGGGWKLQLVKEMKHAGMSVDLSRAV